jgi:hypothetical protein
MGKNTYMHAEKALESSHHTYYSGALFCPDSRVAEPKITATPTRNGRTTSYRLARRSSGDLAGGAKKL